MSQDPGIDPREYGKLEARVQHMENQISELRSDIKSILAILEQSRGSWRVLVFISGAAASLGGLIAWIVSHVTLKTG